MTFILWFNFSAFVKKYLMISNLTYNYSNISIGVAYTISYVFYELCSIYMDFLFVLSTAVIWILNIKVTFSGAVQYDVIVCRQLCLFIEVNIWIIKIKMYIYCCCNMQFMVIPLKYVVMCFKDMWVIHKCGLHWHLSVLEFCWPTKDLSRIW